MLRQLNSIKQSGYFLVLKLAVNSAISPEAMEIELHTEYKPARAKS
jgi:hypothetical protein